MNQVAESLRKNLSFFEELDSLSRKFASAALSVQDPTFLTVMNKVDECIVFMTENVPQMHRLVWLVTPLYHSSCS